MRTITTSGGKMPGTRIPGRRAVLAGLVIVLALTALRRGGAPAPEFEPRLIGLVELPGVFGVRDPDGPPGSVLPFELRPLPLYTRPDAASPVIARVASGDSLRLDEYIEYLPAALAFGEAEDWVLVSLREGEARYAWVPPDHRGKLYDLGTLLEGGLTYLTHDWDGLLRQAPSPASAAREVRLSAGDEEVDINVIRVVETDAATWLHVELLGPGRCATRWVPVVDSGWVPALTANGAPNAWFYSRGC